MSGADLHSRDVPSSASRGGPNEIKCKYSNCISILINVFISFYSFQYDFKIIIYTSNELQTNAVYAMFVIMVFSCRELSY